MATVYAATHRNKKRFAVKLLLPSYSVHKDIRARFLREGYVANTVEHAGAVTVLDDDVAEDGSAFLVMELLEGETVEKLCEGGSRRLEIPAALAVVHQLLDVLVAAHAKGVVHRDIKPANLFVTREGVVKVLDFGIARLREGDESSSTRTGVHMGTPAFMSPEQASGRMSLVDARSDLWSVGATLFYLLTRRNVHVGETAQHIVLLTATTQADALDTVLPGVPRAVSQLVDRALALDKNDRWPSAAAMRDAVAAAYLAIVGETVSSKALLDDGTRPKVVQGLPYFGTQPTVRSEPGPHAEPPTVPATPVSSVGRGTVPSASVTPAPPEVASATMAPVSSSPSPQRGRGWRIVIALALGATLLAAGVIFGVSMRRPTRAESVAPPMQTAAVVTTSTPADPQGGPAPVAPGTGVVDESTTGALSPGDASTVNPTVNPQRNAATPHRAPPPHPSVARPPTTPSAKPNSSVTDFDRQ
jgi:eukaryotic-like serine/threonine-protein kinase